MDLKWWRADWDSNPRTRGNDIEIEDIEYCLEARSGPFIMAVTEGERSLVNTNCLDIFGRACSVVIGRSAFTRDARGAHECKERHDLNVVVVHEVLEEGILDRSTVDNGAFSGQRLVNSG
jgi:hypothetical protein